MKHFVYIIFNKKRNRFYIGSTHDIKIRLDRHNNGWTRSTKGRGDWKLVYSEKFGNKQEALCREREIKRMKSRKYIERLLVDKS